MTRTHVMALALALAADPPARAQGHDVKGVALTASDLPRARAEALKDAMRRAVEQAVEQAAPDLRGRLYLISARARDYVVSYRVVEEGESGEHFEVRVVAQVDLARVLRDLRPEKGAVGRPAGAQGIGILICPMDEGSAAPRPGGDLLQVVRQALPGHLEILPADRCPRPADPRLMAQKRTEAGAAYTILLRAPAPALPLPIRGTLPVLHGARARVEISLAGPGVASAPIDETAEASGFSESPEAAAWLAQKSALAQVLARLAPHLEGSKGERQEGPSPIELSIEGVSSYAALLRLQRALSTLPGVEGVEPRHFLSEGGERTRIVLSVRTRMSPEELAALLQRAPLPGLSQKAIEDRGRRLRLVTTDEPPAPAPAEPPAP